MSYTAETISLSYESLTDNDFPFTIANNVCLKINIMQDQVLKMASNITYLIINLTFTSNSNIKLHVVPPIGTTINGLPVFDLIFNGETATIVRNIGSSSYIIIENSSGSGLPTIGSSTNNAVVRVGNTAGTIANSNLIIDNAGNITTPATITCLDIQNNGTYFISNINGVSMGSQFTVGTVSTYIGIKTQGVISSTGSFIGYGTMNPLSTGNSAASIMIGSQVNPSIMTTNQSNMIMFGYQAYLPSIALQLSVIAGTNNFRTDTPIGSKTIMAIGRNLFNDAAAATGLSGLFIGQNFTKDSNQSILIGSNIAANVDSTQAQTRVIIVGHNSVTNGAQAKTQLTAFGANNNTTLSNAIILGSGINARGLSTVDAMIIGATACSAATALTGTGITVLGYGSSPNIIDSNIVTIGSGSNGIGTTNLFTVGYQAAATATATTCAVLGYQAGQAGNITNSAAIGYQALNAGAQLAAVMGSQAALITTGANNTVVGYNIASTLTTGTNNILVGSGANVSAAARSNSIAIGKGATTSNDNEFALGSAGTALTTQTTIGAAGGASALPATPNTYLFVRLNGTLLRTPLYN